MKKSLRRWAWLAVGGVVLGLIVYNLSRSPEWRDFRWDRLWASITHARPGLLLLSVGMVYATYFMRALRWKYFLDPIQKASLGVLLAAQFLGFSSIYLIGRPGELVRPAYISKKENIPFSAMMAVWLLERIFDGVFMVLLFSTALFFMPLGADSAKGASLLVAVHEGGYALLAFSALVVAFLVLFRLQTETLTRWVIRALG
ncbi:MAG TPA: lysylphosphatidylglycerol synthase transmembrane domain-containing protein, partial [Terriglobia bacterium]|nr:lysylphosphatidylglycerol synthase transmembrane domain-containing protein [Terriglobia bacterium]